MPAGLAHWPAVVPAGQVVLFDSQVPVVAVVRHSLAAGLLFEGRNQASAEEQARVEPLAASNGGGARGSSASGASGKENGDCCHEDGSGDFSGPDRGADSRGGGKSGGGGDEDEEVALSFRLPVAPSRAQIVTMRAAAAAVALQVKAHLRTCNGACLGQKKRGAKLFPPSEVFFFLPLIIAAAHLPARLPAPPACLTPSPALVAAGRGAPGEPDGDRKDAGSACGGPRVPVGLRAAAALQGPARHRQWQQQQRQRQWQRRQRRRQQQQQQRRRWRG